MFGRNIFICVTLKGSLPRPPSVLAYLKDRKDETIPDDILETAVKETVQKQIEVCQDIVKP